MIAFLKFTQWKKNIKIIPLLSNNEFKKQFALYNG